MVQGLRLEIELANHKRQRHHKEKCFRGRICQFLSNQFFSNPQADFSEHLIKQKVMIKWGKRSLSLILSSELHLHALVDTFLGLFHFSKSYIKGPSNKIQHSQSGRKLSIQNEIACFQNSFLFGNFLIWLSFLFPVFGAMRMVLSVRLRIGCIATECLPRNTPWGWLLRRRALPLPWVFSPVSCL